MREIRDAVAGDAAALAEIFHRAVRDGAAAHYTAAQRRAWSPAPPEPGVFWERLSDQIILGAQEGDEVVGFMSMDLSGYLDMAFVHPDRRGTGVADDLLDVLENRALAMGLTRLTTRASHMARSFLLRRGWRAVEAVQVTRDGISIDTTMMERSL